MKLLSIFSATLLLLQSSVNAGKATEGEAAHQAISAATHRDAVLERNFQRNMHRAQAVAEELGRGRERDGLALARFLEQHPKQASVLAQASEQFPEVAEALVRTIQNVPDVERVMAASLAHAQNLEAIISEEVGRNPGVAQERLDELRRIREAVRSLERTLSRARARGL